jgi:hypothetical protein
MRNPPTLHGFLMVAAHAVPSFAARPAWRVRPAIRCFPELTHFGRMFKANAYTLDNLKQVRDIDATKQEMLSLATLPPLADDSGIGNLAQFPAA